MIYQLVKGLSKLTTTSRRITPNIMILKFTIVNAFIIGDNSGWVLVDTGLENSYDYILKSAENQFGKNNPPKAIILTHGHFDHIGSVIKLAEYWNVKVYAHELEIPYLTGIKNYPEPDSTVDEGMVAKISPSFPNEAIDLGNRVSVLLPEGRIPEMADWEWVHTPGHSPGHISLFHELDKILLVGDAFTTTKQESFLSVLTQRKQVKGPPAYLTTDWEAAQISIERLQNLNPQLVLPSHGEPMKGEELSKYMQLLIEHFKEIAVPEEGRFVNK